MSVRSLAQSFLLCLLTVLACADDGPSSTPDAGSDGAIADANIARDVSASADGRTADAPSAGGTGPDATVNTGGAGGMTNTGGTSGTPQDPVCATANASGFFSSCNACPTDNCDSVNGKAACGCDSAADCPCGFRCGCHQLAANVRVCGLCVR